MKLNSWIVSFIKKRFDLIYYKHNKNRIINYLILFQPYKLKKKKKKHAVLVHWNFKHMTTKFNDYFIKLKQFLHAGLLQLNLRHL